MEPQTLLFLRKFSFRKFSGINAHLLNVLRGFPRRESVSLR